MSEVSHYIARFGPEVQERLSEAREIALSAAPGAEERIYYGMPTFYINGKIFLHVPAYKNHISLILCAALIDILKSRYPELSYTQSTIQFPHNEPFPRDLIRELCEISIAMVKGNEPV
jgi:uncharacterized protein YdhG (YjbR/CyaY superfamily)